MNNAGKPIVAVAKPEDVKGGSLATVSDSSIERITSAVDKLTESFGQTYERLKYAGFVSVLGAILVFVPLAMKNIPLVHIDVEEQRLYVTAGVGFVLIAAAWISLQNLLVYKLQRAKQEIACRMLAIKVAAMGEAQRAALETIGETTGAPLADDPFAKG
jgi:hypothetical protein